MIALPSPSVGHSITFLTKRPSPLRIPRHTSASVPAVRFHRSSGIQSTGACSRRCKVVNRHSRSKIGRIEAVSAMRHHTTLPACSLARPFPPSLFWRPTLLPQCQRGPKFSRGPMSTCALLFFLFVALPSAAHRYLDCVVQLWLQLPRFGEAECRLASSPLS